MRCIADSTQARSTCKDERTICGEKERLSVSSQVITVEC